MHVVVVVGGVVWVSPGREWWNTVVCIVLEVVFEVYK